MYEIPAPFDPALVKRSAAKMWTTETPTVHASDYEKLLALFQVAILRANTAEKKLKDLEAEVAHPNFYLRALNCPHQIDAEQIVLKFDPRQHGNNALDQLSRRLTAPLHETKSKVRAESPEDPPA